MKKLITISALLFSSMAFGQTADDYLQSGIDKHKKADYEGAISDYSKAIKADKNNSDAYFNRGTCKLALKDFAVGDSVTKYGCEIGKIVQAVKAGHHVHTHNLKTKRWA